MGFIRDSFESISGKVSDLVGTKRVLQPNARTKCRFAGHVIGRYRRNGPNPWNDYELVPEDAGPIDVFPSIEVQVEPERSRFRMRARGQVLMVQWTPTEEETATIRSGVSIHELFMETCVTPFGNAKGMGVAAFVARTLRR